MAMDTKYFTDNEYWQELLENISVFQAFNNLAKKKLTSALSASLVLCVTKSFNWITCCVSQRKQTWD